MTWLVVPVSQAHGPWLLWTALAAGSLAAASRFQGRHDTAVVGRTLAIARPGCAPLRTPEQMFGYRADDLETFMAALDKAPLGDGRTVLDLYVSPMLLYRDVLFAMALGAFAVLLDLWLSPYAARIGNWLGSLVLMAAAAGGLYAVADVCEDLALARILSSRKANPSATAVSSSLTRAKLVLITFSGSGALLLGAASAVVALVPELAN